MASTSREQAPQPSAVASRSGTGAAPITGKQLLEAFGHAAGVIADHREQLNALNVFPVPDGDTGTNMSLTMRSAMDAVARLGESPEPTADNVASTIAFGALMGARGNSGVILSQILRGFANAVEGREVLGASDLATALQRATDVAYKAVLKPVEGTMLSVIAGAAQAAAAASSDDPPDVLVAAADGAEAALARTPESLDILRQARVVDAGGQGVAYILRAMANRLRGDLAVIQIGEAEPIPALANLEPGADGHYDESGYCTNFVIRDSGRDQAALRRDLDTIGTSTVIVGDEHLLRIHVHTLQPDQALAVAMRYGELDKVTIDNMDQQVRDIAERIEESNRNVLRQGEVTGRHAVVAVSEGPGQTEALLALGATAVIEVRNEAKPSTEELLRAVESAPADDVILLPNASETIPTARIVTGVTDKRIEIVPSASFIAGLVALGAMQETAAIGTNAAAMTSALERARSVEIARASKDATVDGVAVAANDWLFFVNGTLHHAGTDLDSTLGAGFATVAHLDPEICTVFTGRDTDDAEVVAIQAALGAAFPEAEIEVVAGGQAFYHAIIGFE